MQHFFSVDQLSTEMIYSLCEEANQLSMSQRPLSDQIFVANIFTEPSTRTKLSFLVAERKLGLEILDVAAGDSSIAKGETLKDTAVTLEALGAQALVIRDRSNTWMEEIDNHVSIPVINAGAGTTEHPTQCMLDVYTLYKEFGRLSDLNVVIVGDVKHSRVAHSNIRTLQRLGVSVYTSCAPSFIDPTLDVPNISMDEAVKIADCMMLLRIQFERHEDEQIETTNYLDSYGLTKKREQNMKPDAIIMHPGPVNRNVEIDESLVYGERSRIKEQIQNGVNIRMAILQYMLTKWGIINEPFTNERLSTNS